MKIKLIGIAVICVFLAYICLPTNESKTAYADNGGNGSTIAGVNVEGLDKEEIEKALQKEVKEWIKTPILVSDGAIEMEIDSNQLEFDFNSTISNYESQTDKPWYLFWESDRVVHLPLQVLPNDEIKNEIASIGTWNADETYNQLLAQASYLKDHEINATVNDSSLYENERLALTIGEIPEDAAGIYELSESLNNLVINPGESFSFLEHTGEATSVANSEGINFVASLLYSAVLQTEYELLERHSQKTVPPYLELGMEAAIDIYSNKDLKFYNQSEYPAKIKTSTEGNSMKLEITSDEKVKEVLVQVEKEIIQPRIIERYSDELPIGSEELIQEGNSGYRIEVYRTISESGSAEEEVVSRDYYAPTNRIVLKSSRQPITAANDDNSTPNTANETSKTTENDDPDLEIDIDGDGLPDLEAPKDEDKLPPGSYYDKGGNLVTP